MAASLFEVGRLSLPHSTSWMCEVVNKFNLLQRMRLWLGHASQQFARSSVFNYLMKTSVDLNLADHATHRQTTPDCRDPAPSFCSRQSRMSSTARGKIFKFTHLPGLPRLPFTKLFTNRPNGLGERLRVFALLSDSGTGRPGAGAGLAKCGSE